LKVGTEKITDFVQLAEFAPDRQCFHRLVSQLRENFSRVRL